MLHSGSPENPFGEMGDFSALKYYLSSKPILKNLWMIRRFPGRDIDDGSEMGGKRPVRRFDWQSQE